MNLTRSPRATYVAAFILGALIALLLFTPARGADPFRLDRVAIVRFTPLGADRLTRQTGVLHVDGHIQWRFSTEVARPASTPDYALNRPLILGTAWSAYFSLGTFVLSGFMLEEGGINITVGTEIFKAVTPNPEPYMFDGRVINLSTRATLGAAGDEIVAGFVIEGRPRPVLVRVIGPGLTRFGLTNAAADPRLSLRQNGQALLASDNWSSEANASLIAAASAHVGAFPLETGARDAASVVTLAPGVYTLHAQSVNPALGGAVLLEIYSLPDDAIYDIAAAR
jgi:hypothetical protein